MKNSIEWNIQNVPMRHYDPLPILTLEEYDFALQQFLRRWLRHNEHCTKETDNDLISYTIHRDEIIIGKIEFEYLIGKPYLFFGTHLIAHERAIEEYGHERKGWPDSARKSVDRMMFFYLDALRMMRELEGHDKSRQPNPKKECRAKLLQILTNLFDENELKTLCFHLNVAYEDLPAIGKINKARELITSLERRNQIVELLECGRELRPDIPWPSKSNCT